MAVQLPHLKTQSKTATLLITLFLFCSYAASLTYVRNEKAITISHHSHYTPHTTHHHHMYPAVANTDKKQNKNTVRIILLQLAYTFSGWPQKLFLVAVAKQQLHPIWNFERRHRKFGQQQKPCRLVFVSSLRRLVCVCVRVIWLSSCCFCNCHTSGADLRSSPKG